MMTMHKQNNKKYFVRRDAYFFTHKYRSHHMSRNHATDGRKLNQTFISI